MVFIIFITFSRLTEFIQYEAEGEGINVSNILGRIDWALHPFTYEDASADERKEVIGLSWEMISARPLIGNGIASTVIWNKSVSTHNIYLYYLVDYGVIGLFILPLLLLASIWRAGGEARQTALPFLVFILFFGFFSHNIVEEYYFLISFALMAAMSASSRFNKGQAYMTV